MLNDPERPPLPRQCQTVHEVISLYLPQARREMGAEGYEYAARYIGLFDQAYGSTLVANLRPFDIQSWLNLMTTLRSECTIRRVISCIKRAFNWALDMEIISRNPIGRFRSRGMLTHRRVPMSDEHFQTYLRCSAPVYRRLLIFLKFTGCRPGEAASMRWSNVDFEQRCVILKDHKTAKKTGKVRWIPLIPTVLKMLMWMRVRKQATVVGLLERLLSQGPMKGIDVARFLSHYGISDRAGARARKSLGVIKEHVGGYGGHWIYRLPDDHVPMPPPDEDGHVFMTCYGNPLNKHNLTCYMQRTRRRAGNLKGVILYQLRHRFFFQGIKNNVNLKLLSLAGGHETTAITNHYINAAGLTDEILQAALQVAHGPGAFLVGAKPAPVPVSDFDPHKAKHGPASLECLPRRIGNPRQRPCIKADLADVPMPKPSLSDPGEESVESLMKFYMAKQSGQRKVTPRRPTSSTTELSSTHELAFQSHAWAVERNPDLAIAKDREVFEWLQSQADCPFKLPPTFDTWVRYVTAARKYHGCLRRVLPPRKKRQG